MSDEYEYGPWIGWNQGVRPVSALCQIQAVVLGPLRPFLGEPRLAGDLHWNLPESADRIIAYRVATPKPKRELVVGKWYLSRAGNWRRVIAIEHNNERGAVWMTPFDSPDEAALWRMEAAIDVTDWSTPPRDEAPDE